MQHTVAQQVGITCPFGCTFCVKRSNVVAVNMVPKPYALLDSSVMHGTPLNSIEIVNQFPSTT